MMTSVPEVPVAFVTVKVIDVSVLLATEIVGAAEGAFAVVRN